jgi:hypothetical protein
LVSLYPDQQSEASTPLSEGGSITGFVARADAGVAVGVGVRAVLVKRVTEMAMVHDGRPNLWLGGRFTESAVTDGQGNYRLDRLPDGDYLVWFEPTRATGLAGAFFGGVGDSTVAPLVSVRSGEVTSAVSAMLVRGGAISGQLRDVDGTPLEGAEVSALLVRRHTESPAAQWDVTTPRPAFVVGYRFTESVITDAKGNYRLQGLLDGDYVVWFDSPPDAEGRAEFYGGVRQAMAAPQVAVGLGAEVAGVDHRLSDTSSVEGVITRRGVPLARARVSVVMVKRLTESAANVSVSPPRFAVGYTTAPFAITDGQGRYRIDGVIPGTYVLLIEPAPPRDFEWQYYPGRFCASVATRFDVLPLSVTERPAQVEQRWGRPCAASVPQFALRPASEVGAPTS